MRPEGIESNHFAYHLEKLISGGLVEKCERQYLLTSQGLSLADRLNHSTIDIKIRPHIVVAPHITNGQGQDLLYQHSFQPYLDLFGPPQGRLEYDDESALAAACRETKEKTGLDVADLEHRGIVYVTANSKGSKISKILVHVFTGQVSGVPKLSASTAKGRPLWGDATQLTAGQCMPGYLQIRELLQTNPGLFFDEIVTEL
jgi:ADP-ribose pyrophosphatase YjhB (NUDIX family)